MKSILRDTLTFTQTIEIASERIHDLLTTGLEGGCDYWLATDHELIKQESKKFEGELNIQNQIMQGGTLHCFDAEEPDAKLGELNVFKVVSALQAMADGKDLKGKKNDHLKWHFKNFIEENDDCETADVVIQIAVMGEIVFG